MKYLYALMDDEIRFWIAQQVGDTKYTVDVNPLLKKGKEIARKRPNNLISDGAPTFIKLLTKNFGQETIQGQGRSVISDCKETTITQNGKAEW